MDHVESADRPMDACERPHRRRSRRTGSRRASAADRGACRTCCTVAIASAPPLTGARVRLRATPAGWELPLPAQAACNSRRDRLAYSRSRLGIGSPGRRVSRTGTGRAIGLTCPAGGGHGRARSGACAGHAVDARSARSWEHRAPRADTKHTRRAAAPHKNRRRRPRRGTRPAARLGERRCATCADI